MKQHLQSNNYSCFPEKTANYNYGSVEVMLFLCYFMTPFLEIAVEEFESLFVDKPNAFSYLGLLEKEVCKGKLPWQSLYIALDFRLDRYDYLNAKKYSWILKYWEYKGLNDLIDN